jgi:hypothetical protein
MSLNNDSNIGLTINKKSNILYDEVDLISSSNRRIEKAHDNNAIEISSTEKTSQKQDKPLSDLVYGASIDIRKPTNIGSVKAFLYIKDFPLIIIGPDCK